MSTYDNTALYNSLKELKVIDETQLDEAFRQSQTQGIALDKILLDKDLISDEHLGSRLSELLSVPLIRLADVSIPSDVLQLIPEVVAKKQKIIAFKKDKEGLHLAMNDPTDLEMIEFVKKKVGLPVVVHFATEREVGNALSLYRKNVAQVFEEIIATSVEQAKGATKPEPPIITIVDTILSYAYQNKASDIHIEPEKEQSLIRFRIDGILHDIVGLPLTLHPAIVSRIKVLSRLRTDEHQAAQDGRFQYKAVTENVDMRVSIVPATNGEKIVMRLLSEHSRQFSLTDLGLLEKDFEKVKSAYQKPYGMVLATGPTGCGKTTTIYAILKLLNQRDVNIMTIEDPVEYEIEGVNQIQVNPKTNLTFADGLRSILRQDPNVILIGEIRDGETAKIAINSAMTGHLVLSTLHTNDSATSLPRLMDMGVEPFLIGSTLNVIIAQRLVRKIHKVCRVSREMETSEIEQKLGKELTQKVFGKAKVVRTYVGKGCTLDHGTGYEDRIGIFEVLVIDDEIRKAILERKDASNIKTIAIKNGMTTMIEDGLEKVKEGMTTIDEIIRVTKE